MTPHECVNAEEHSIYKLSFTIVDIVNQADKI